MCLLKVFFSKHWMDLLTKIFNIKTPDGWIDFKFLGLSVNNNLAGSAGHQRVKSLLPPSDDYEDGYDNGHDDGLGDGLGDGHGVCDDNGYDNDVDADDGDVLGKFH